MYVAILGNAVKIVGPFKTRADANAYLDAFVERYPRWLGYSQEVAAIETPDQTTKQKAGIAE